MGQYTEDVRLQAEYLREYAEANDFEVVQIFVETKGMDLGKRVRIAAELSNAFAKRKEVNAILMMVNIGRWRSNFIVDKLRAEYRAKKKVKHRIIEIPATRKIFEAIERQARKEKLHRLRVRARRTPKRISKTEVETWQEERGVSTKRLRNFHHLYKGIVSIYDIVTENAEMSARHLADLLDKQAYLTVDNKRWSEHNVRKVRQLFNSDEFKEFCAIKKRELED